MRPINLKSAFWVQYLKVPWKRMQSPPKKEHKGTYKYSKRVQNSASGTKSLDFLLGWFKRTQPVGQGFSWSFMDGWWFYKIRQRMGVHLDVCFRLISSVFAGFWWNVQWGWLGSVENVYQPNKTNGPSCQRFFAFWFGLRRSILKMVRLASNSQKWTNTNLRAPPPTRSMFQFSSSPTCFKMFSPPSLWIFSGSSSSCLHLEILCLT